MRTHLLRIMFVLILAGVLAACGGDEAPATAVDTDALVATVAAEIALQQAESEPAATPAAEATAEPLLPVGNGSSPLSGLTELQASLVGVYERANPSVVFILVPPLGSGSGFVYSEDGKIVTNNHVVAGGSEYEIVFANGDRREARLLGSDVDSDLAVLQVDDLPAGVEPLGLGDSDALRVGQLVVAIGNPFGEAGSMSLGIISALGRSLTSQRRLEGGSTYSLPGVVQTDAPINPGNSGGPLLNLEGEVVGINSAIATFTGTNSGVGFAIPVQAVRQIVPSLISDGSYLYPYMGIGFDEELSLSDLDLFGVERTQGAYVLSVTPGSPAEDAGIIAADPSTGQGGDLVIAIDDEPVTDFNDLNSYLVFHTSPGQTIDLTVIRDGEELVVPLTLAERP